MSTGESNTSPRLVEYPGSCHCGAFKFILKIPELKSADACNCSICSRNGYLWAFPSSEHFVVIKGDEDKTLKEYRFGKRIMAHKFCLTCGTSVMGRVHKPDGAQSIAINVRALEDIDPESLVVRTSNLALKEPQYQSPTPLVVDSIEPGMEIYHGNCHCGAITYAVQKDSPVTEATYCNCSICSRDAALWIYPLAALVAFRDLSALVEYAFGPKKRIHGFCNICGVAIRERFLIEGDKRMAINVRTMNGLDLDSLAVEKFDGKALLPKVPQAEAYR
ncbi:glutathione-dependent formaldehyde-activating enzyme [Mycena rebaudengoi]|nr:glutathione-dependent formaldehyde-activating enzyme [Mycena rebaudengoi]